MRFQCCRSQPVHQWRQHLCRQYQRTSQRTARRSFRSCLVPAPAHTPLSPRECRSDDEADNEDRKSTRLNSSHVRISYAVFCLKKKTKTIIFFFFIKKFSIITSHIISTTKIHYYTYSLGYRRSAYTFTTEFFILQSSYSLSLNN